MMKILKYFAAFAVISTCSTSSFSQTIDASRRVDWSIAGVEGGIPCVTDPDQIFNIMDYGGNNTGSSDNYSAIQSALSAASSSGEPIRVIYFPAGEYLVNSSISVPSNTIFRGDSYTDTKFTFDLGGTADPCFQTPIWNFGNYTNVTGGHTKGSTSITVANGSELTIGQWMEIEEDNDPAAMYTNATWNQTWAQYAKGQFVRVTNISGNTITFDRPLKTDYDAARTIRARRALLAENIGFENFYITRPNTGDSYMFFLKNTSNTWIRGVYSWRSNKAHVWTERCVNFEIRGCYFERSIDYGGGGHGYGISVGYHSHDGLMENNIFNRLRHHMIIAKGASGCVFGYNYTFDRVQGSDTNDLNNGWIPPDISIHGHWSYMNLFEGNVSQEIHSADYWGASGPGTTFFRNQLQAVEGVYLDDASVDQNVVGNELLLGSVGEDASVTGTFEHGNVESGTATWNGGSGSNNLIDSYYLTAKPSWWGSGSWPSIGPEYIGSGTNPAKDRWDAQGANALSYCLDCNGDVGGTASTDVCGDCVGGNTGATTLDTDNDGTPDCNDNCINDINKTEPGACGCGVAEGTCNDCNGDAGGTATTDACGDCVGGNTGATTLDTDNDGTPDCNDNCVNDINKTEPGDCGCGVAEGTCDDCNGDAGGTATTDVCGNCSGGNTGITPETDINNCVNGIGDDIDRKYGVYPSPTNSKATISGFVQGDNWYLTDTRRKILLTGDREVVDLNQLPSGVYFIFINEAVLSVVKQ